MKRAVVFLRGIDPQRQETQNQKGRFCNLNASIGVGGESYQ